jgi:PRC-barrel domain
MSVQNAQGEHLGEIEDVAIDAADGRIAYAAMDTGLLGPLLAIPWEALGVAQDKPTVTLHVAKEALQKAPTFQCEKWRNCLALNVSFRPFGHGDMVAKLS